MKKKVEFFDLVAMTVFVGRRAGVDSIEAHIWS